jgi:hypothetical protein
METYAFLFLAPAFKINPALFLRWCRQLTATPAPMDLSEDFSAKNIYPVTLPVTDRGKFSPYLNQFNG